VRGHTEGLESLVHKARSGTRNSSAPGPDSIGYKLIKATMKTKLGKEPIKEIEGKLEKGVIPAEWQHSKVVMIPKPSKDQSKTKGW